MVWFVPHSFLAKNSQYIYPGLNSSPIKGNEVLNQSVMKHKEGEEERIISLRNKANKVTSSCTLLCIR